jgi:radical SAM protein with 4Fe4S-binding SPASM domain
MSGTAPDLWPVAPPLPAALQVEITSACNLRCAMCLVRYRPPVNKLTGAMSMELFRRIVDGLPGLRRLTLQGLGEPLLSPHLLAQIRYAKRAGVTVGFNSNATLLTRDRADELVASGLDWLHVSVDGARAETYRAIRGAELDRVLANLGGLVAAKRAAGSATPWIRVVFVAMRRNVDELPDLVRTIAALGVDELRVQNLSHSFDDTDPSGGYAEIREFTAAEALWTGHDVEAAERAFTAARAAADEHGLLLRLPSTEGTGPTGLRQIGPVTDRHRPACTWPWDSAYVTSSGVVQPCCMVMGDDRVALGRLDRESFADIWHGAPYQEFRRRLTAGAQPPDVCRGCALYHHTF